MFWIIGVMLTNAYVIYKKLNEEYGVPKKQWMSQHDFRKAIAITWINPQFYQENYVDNTTKNTGKRAWQNDVSSLSSTSNQSKTMVAQKVTDDSLHPLTGKLSCRLNSELNHLPIAKGNPTSRCAIYWWAGGDKTYSNVM